MAWSVRELPTVTEVALVCVEMLGVTFGVEVEAVMDEDTQLVPGRTASIEYP